MRARIIIRMRVRHQRGLCLPSSSSLRHHCSIHHRLQHLCRYPRPLLGRSTQRQRRQRHHFLQIATSPRRPRPRPRPVSHLILLCPQHSRRHLAPIRPPTRLTLVSLRQHPIPPPHLLPHHNQRQLLCYPSSTVQLSTVPVPTPLPPLPQRRVRPDGDHLCLTTTLHSRDCPSYTHLHEMMLQPLMCLHRHFNHLR